MILILQCSLDVGDKVSQLGIAIKLMNPCHFVDTLLLNALQAGLVWCLCHGSIQDISQVKSQPYGPEMLPNNK